MSKEKFKINLKEKFPRLTKTCIVEAVVEIRARTELPWEEKGIREKIESQITDYNYSDSSREFQQVIEKGQPSPIQDMGFNGIRYKSKDGLHVVQFNKTEFVLSRLAPYESHIQLFKEALRLWEVHKQLSQPKDIQRIGIRFINRIEIPEDKARFNDFIKTTISNFDGIEHALNSFLHQERFDVEGYPYGINIIKTMQPISKDHGKKIASILDIDVFTLKPFETDDKKINLCLQELRWLKNKIFFQSITDKTLEMIR